MSETRPKACTSFSTSTAADRSHTQTPSSRPEWILLRAREATPPRQTTTPGRLFARISLQNSRADPRFETSTPASWPSRSTQWRAT